LEIFNNITQNAALRYLLQNKICTPLNSMRYVNIWQYIQNNMHVNKNAKYFIEYCTSKSIYLHNFELVIMHQHTTAQYVGFDEMQTFKLYRDIIILILTLSAVQKHDMHPT